MPDTRVTGLTANTAPLSTDLVPLIDDPGGVPLSQKIALADLMALFKNPVTDDGAALGTTALRWADLFLASGGVINFNNGNVTLTHAAGVLTLAGAELVLAAGTTTLAPLTLQSGTNLTTPGVGDHEFDGTAYFRTTDTTSGRTQAGNQNIFRLAANGTAIGPAIADYFGANSSFPTVTNGVYELTFLLYYLKTTAGTVTYTLTNTQTYTNIAASYEQSVVGGIATNGAMSAAGIVTTTTAAAALPATGSLTTAVNHLAIVRVTVECGTAGNIRLRVTSSAGTVTPLRGSYYTARRLFAGNVGTFAA